MKSHECKSDCPRCGESLSLTTEWGWINDRTCTAILCCPSCRIESGWTEAAVIGCDAPTEAEALEGVSVDALLEQMHEQRELFDDENEWAEEETAEEANPLELNHLVWIKEKSWRVMTSHATEQEARAAVRQHRENGDEAKYTLRNSKEDLALRANVWQ